MSIKVQCPNPACGKIFSVKEEHAGRKAKCPGCSSPLIIPAPEGEVFDFGSLAGGAPAAPEPANPFADLTGAPAPTLSKSRPAKKPAPEPPSPPGQPGTAAPPVAEVLVEPVPESLPPGAVTALVPVSALPVAGPEAITPVADSGSSADAPRAEPWYYGFLEGYAKVLMYLGLLAVVLGTLFSFWTAVLILQVDPVNAVVHMVLTLVTAAFAVLGVLLSVAFLLLCVDAARNLRETRRLLARGGPEKSNR